MIFVALLELGVIVVLCYLALSALRAQARSHARREDLLLNQVLHAKGTPWQPAPADTSQQQIEAVLEAREAMLSPRVFTQTPEQEP